MLQGLFCKDYILYVTGFLLQGIIFSMLRGLYGKDYILYVTGSLLQGLYSLCYRVSMARIIFSMLQGLYGEDEIVTMGTQIFILGVDLPTETGKLYFCRIIFYRMPLFVKNKITFSMAFGVNCGDRRNESEK